MTNVADTLTEIVFARDIATVHCHYPDRPRNPATPPELVRGAADLPPWLMVGFLDIGACSFDTDGWHAVWRTEPDVLQVNWSRAERRFRLELAGRLGFQIGVWSSDGCDLARAVLQTFMTFEPWRLGKAIAPEVSLSAGRLPGGLRLCGMPDGPLVTLAILLGADEVEAWLDYARCPILPHQPHMFGLGALIGRQEPVGTLILPASGAHAAARDLLSNGWIAAADSGGLARQGVKRSLWLLDGNAPLEPVRPGTVH